MGQSHFFEANRIRARFLPAHMDEPCIIATSFTDSGRIKFDRVGSIPPAALLGKRVRFEKALGVIECVPPHLLSGDELSKIPDTKDMCIDIGAKDKKEATDHVSYGDMGVFDGVLRNSATDFSAARDSAGSFPVPL